MNWWMVRAGGGELIPQWVEKGKASVGWSALGNPQRFQERKQLIQESHKVYSDLRPGARIQAGSQIWRFANEIKVGDRIVTYDKDAREYILGTVTHEHHFDPTVISDYYPNVIGVKWEKQRVPRDSLSQKAKNSLGGIATVFRVDAWGSEFEQLLAGDGPIVSPDTDDLIDSDEDTSHEDFAQQATSMVEDEVSKLDPWAMQDLVAGLLQAMGYQVRVSPPGPDGGIDVLAHKDAFGFEKPIIKVQVKHRKSTTGAPEIQQLLGANPISANSIFVSTGGFTQAAVSTAKHDGVRLVDLSELVELILKWYEHLPSEKKSLLPLRKLYVPF
ncbi:MAG TPA: restriction endonuclease [Bacillota bacterium]|nr:restriction endonuclease [Bacillota bacterium]